MRSTQIRIGGSALAGAVVLTGGVVSCGEDPVLDSSNRGTGSHTQDTTVENAYIVPAYVPGRCAIQLEAGGEMRFTVTNNRALEPERLLGLSTSAAQQARVIDSVDIAPESAVSFGQPNVQPGDDAASGPAVQLDRLDPGLRPATTADVTFHFQQAGDLTMPVPVEACPVQER